MFTHKNIINPIDLKSTDTNNGRFYFTPNGAKYPSITTILGSTPKQGILDWRESLGHVAADKEMKRAAERGTAVHLMNEKFLNNESNPIENQKTSDIAEFNSLKMLLRNVNNIVAQETALYSDILKVAGRVDCIAEYKGKLSIIDFKTSTNSKKSEMIGDYFKQTAAYAIMFGEMYDIHIDNIVILMSVENGLPLVFERSVDENIKPLIKTINTYYNKKR